MCPASPSIDSELRSLRGGFVERVSTGLAALREFEGDEGLVSSRWSRVVCETKDLPSYNAYYPGRSEGDQQ